MTEASWTGAERRGIPIEILNYVKSVVADETKEIKQSFAEYREEFASHDADEMRRYDQILENQKINAQAAESRYAELIRSVDSYTEKTEHFQDSIKDAFLVNRHGKPDFVGHAEAHQAWVTEASENQQMRQFIKRTIIGASTVGVGSWITMLMWSGLLQGPK
jgi:predicted Ser/Thr protein kinase